MLLTVTGGDKFILNRLLKEADVGMQELKVAATRTGQESFEPYTKRNNGKILEALESATHWQDLHETMKARGMGIKPHGNGLVITDLHDEHTTKASMVGRSLSAKRLLERFGEFRPYRNLRQIQENSRYQAGSTPEKQVGCHHKEENTLSSDRKSLVQSYLALYK